MSRAQEILSLNEKGKAKKFMRKHKKKLIAGAGVAAGLGVAALAHKMGYSPDEVQDKITQYATSGLKPRRMLTPLEPFNPPPLPRVSQAVVPTRASGIAKAIDKVQVNYPDRSMSSYGVGVDRTPKPRKIGGTTKELVARATKMVPKGPHAQDVFNDRRMQIPMTLPISSKANIQPQATTIRNVVHKPVYTKHHTLRQRDPEAWKRRMKAARQIRRRVKDIGITKYKDFVPGTKAGGGFTG